LALLSQRSRSSPAAVRKPLLRLLRPLRLPRPLLRLPLLRLLRLPTPLLRLPLLRPLQLPMPLLRLLRRRTDPTGSGMKARAGRNPVCTGFRVFAA
jgi:hypothetical protein